MGLEAVKEEILGNAKKEADAMTAEARKEANMIARGAENRIKEIKEKNDAETRRIIDAIKRQELASAELENKKMLLEVKKQVIEIVFLEARKKLESLEDEKREAYIKRLLEKAKNDIKIAYAYLNKKDERFLKEFKSEHADIIGGLIAENKEKTVRVDYSFETLLQSIKENELQNISKILFS